MSIDVATREVVAGLFDKLFDILFLYQNFVINAVECIGISSYLHERKVFSVYF